MSVGGGWGDVGKQKKKTRERRTGITYGAHHFYVQTDMSPTFFCKDKCRQETVTKCIASKGTHLCDTHCVIHMQYLMVKSTLSGTLLFFYLVNISSTQY